MLSRFVNAEGRVGREIFRRSVEVPVLLRQYFSSLFRSPRAVDLESHSILPQILDHLCPSSAITSLTKLRSIYSAGLRFGLVFNAMACHCAINSTPRSVGTASLTTRII